MEAVHALFYPLFTQAKATSGVEKLILENQPHCLLKNSNDNARVIIT
jgi:hypothetical protein